jgi:hypothetical protein
MTVCRSADCTVDLVGPITDRIVGPFCRGAHLIVSKWPVGWRQRLGFVHLAWSFLVFALLGSSCLTMRLIARVDCEVRLCEKRMMPARQACVAALGRHEEKPFV